VKTPGFPANEIQEKFVGSSNKTAPGERSVFTRFSGSIAKENGKPINENLLKSRGLIESNHVGTNLLHYSQSIWEKQA